MLSLKMGKKRRRRRRRAKRFRLITVWLTPQQLNFIEKLIEMGLIGNRCEFIRFAVAKLIFEYTQYMMYWEQKELITI